jgi:5-formaminoimidazole-4-carboxamide-1-(beta)-D-ribofuranosyl 5'-monophosphate synthetase
MNLAPVLKRYDVKNLTIGTLGGHSALDVCLGAKLQGFNTVVVAQKGREQTYQRHYSTRGKTGIVDQVILVNQFTDLTSPTVIKKLQNLNTLFVQSRYFWVYCDHDAIENNFPIPIIGTRGMVKREERDLAHNQYHLMQKAGIRYPQIVKNPQQIDQLVIVKVPEKTRAYERAFFLAGSYSDYQEKSRQLIKSGRITKKALTEAVIEEFILGAQVNFNFFYSPLKKRVELLGTDTRRQTNLDGWLRLPAPDQLELSKYHTPSYIETGHLAVTIKESLLENAFGAAEKLIKVTQKNFPPGLIGPFALQGAIISGPPKEELIVFDLSLRIPGSPGVTATPYGSYLYRRPISVGERIAMEIKHAVRLDKLTQVIT